MKKSLSVICILASAILFLPSAEAALVTFNYSGDFSSQIGFTSPVIDFTGATVTGSYTFDDQTTDTHTLPGVDIGQYPGALTNLSGIVTYSGSSSFSFGAVNGEILIVNDELSVSGSFRDRYHVTSSFVDTPTDTLSGYSFQNFSLHMISIQNPNNDITSTALTSVPPNLFGFVPPAEFGYHTIVMSFDPSLLGGSTLTFNMTSLTAEAAPVPIPSTLLLLGSGLAGLVGIGRRRFKK